MSSIRLNRLLALAGVASRRRCDEIVRAGRVSVDGVVVTAPGTAVDPERQAVRVDGRAVSLEAPVSYLLNKPVGVLSAARDARGQRTVLDLAREAGVRARVYPVGRLDRHTRGLIVLTNEGELAHRLTHPRYEVPRVYEARLNLPITRTQMRRFAAGLELADGPTRPCRIRALPGRARYEVTLGEGRNRQVRRMFEALGRRVDWLKRHRLGPLSLGRLPEGALRELTAEERARLKRAVGLR
ncbi:MAG: rRNA pseudouridine synthase [Candidatus Krumholzibacteriota bacterium]|nr:rRNA pseudouridine synthase [Candidatus Krumholzibacteriota bacterium]